MSYKILNGNCLELLKTLDDNSVDSIVTDPPYGLSNHKLDDVIGCLSAWISGESYNPNKKGFMGKEWDAWVPGPEIWREALRVLKPGGHILAFAGTRSMDLMCISIRLAGFELRDSIGWAHDEGGAPLLSWVYSSGFPKSLDISKAIDKAAGALDNQSVGFNVAGKNSGLGVIQRKELRSDNPEYQKYSPSTESAQQWQGWGSALKPSWEPIILARKPLEGTLVSNVLKYGTGGINIDECRIDGKPPSVAQPSFNRGFTRIYNFRTGEGRNGEMSEASGRWPANTIIDGSEEVVSLFPKTTNNSIKKSYSYSGREYNNKETSMFNSDKPQAPSNYNDSGSAARFFYCSKASKKDREEYNDHPTVKPNDLMRYLCRLITPPGGIVLDLFMGSGSTGKAALMENFHFIGIEMDEHYCEIADKRLSSIKTTITLDSLFEENQ
jgi:site-specific DNA-methyltransferase (adenine-specific)